MADSFGIPLSGIDAAITKHNVSANNVANINTPGYERATAHQTDMSPHGTRISRITRTPNPDPTLSGADLSKEAGEIKANKAAFQADVKMVKVKDDMLKSILDIFA